MARRKELFEARKEAERNSGANCPENTERGRPEGFASETSKATGKDKRTINRAASRGQLGPEDSPSWASLIDREKDVPALID